MTFYYVEDYFDFEYAVSFAEIRIALREITGYDDLDEYCEQEGFEDEYVLAEWFRDELKDYFYEEALEWYRENSWQSDKGGV